MQISFTPEFAGRLRRDMRLENSAQHNPHGGGNTYQLERALDEDMLLTSVGWANSYYAGSSRYTDEWGIEWAPQAYETKFGKGYYTEIVRHPLADTTALDHYQPPDPTRPGLYHESERVLRDLGSEYWIVGVTVTTIWETAWALRGLEQMLMDLVEDPDLADRILDIPYHYHLAAARKLTQMGVDMIWIGDDIGAQHGMLMAPELWRRFLKPRLANFIQTVKQINPRAKVAYHSDGNIYAIIPDLIEIGLDVLNPVQPASMDPSQLKKDFGDKLCFWGTIDEQHTLPFGTPTEVAQEVRHRLETVGRDGGLIIGPTHHVQLDTPLENFWAMVKAIQETPARSISSGRSRQ